MATLVINQSMTSSLGPVPNTTAATTSIAPVQLSHLLSQEQNTIILDIRDFTTFTQNHIITSINIVTNSIIQRRLQRGIISPLDLIKEQVSTDSEIESTAFVIICHTEKGLCDFQNPKSFAYVLLQKLKSIYGDNTLYLQGGFESFSNNFPHLCTSTQDVCATIPLSKLRSESLGLNATIPVNNSFQSEMSKITSSIFISGKDDALNLEKLKENQITHILNMTVDIPNKYPEHFSYMQIMLKDSHTQNIYQHFKTTFAFIDSALQVGGRVLVHCYAGVSRSSTIVTAYLMKNNQWNCATSLAYVRSQRPCIDPNLGFMGELNAFEEELTVHNYLPLDTQLTSLQTCDSLNSIPMPWSFAN